MMSIVFSCVGEKRMNDSRRIFGWAAFIQIVAFLSFIIVASSDAVAQKKARVSAPSADKIISDYIKAIGGKKRAAAIKDAIYDWTREDAADNSVATMTSGARWQIKSPTAARFDFFTPDGEKSEAASARSAWVRDADGAARTLTDAASANAKLWAAIEASNLVDWRKAGILARTIGGAQAADEKLYTIEFSTREGAQVRASFGATSKLLRKLVDVERHREIALSDYQLQPNGVMEPRRVIVWQDDAAAASPISFVLRRVSYNTNLSDAIFDPPSESGAINIPELLVEVERNQKQVDERVSEYTFTRKQIEREITDQGEVKREKVIVHEVYPVRGGGRVLKLISEDGVPLSPERAAKEEKRVAEEIEKIERDNQKQEEKRARQPAQEAEKNKPKSGETGAGKDGDEDVAGIATFLRACAFVAPRRERFRDRETIVFDFRPRADFHPINREEAFIGKLVGVVWIDPQDKQVMRLEARLSEGFKLGGGLLASIRQGSAFIIEQTRMSDGVWLPRLTQINASAKVFLLAGLRLNAVREYGDYKKFNATTESIKLDEVKEKH